MAMAAHTFAPFARHSLTFGTTRATALSVHYSTVSAVKFCASESLISAPPNSLGAASGKTNAVPRDRDVSVSMMSTRSGQDTPGGKDDEEEGAAVLDLDFDISRLEVYTERVHSEVLRVKAMVDEEEDLVIIFKGFSSSLMRPTPDDLSEPVLPSTTLVLGIDRLQGPYNPSRPRYIQKNMSWQDFQQFLLDSGL